jgi:hypothetical protein
MKILSAYWFTDARDTTIGVVVGEDEVTGERKAYIGRGDGIDQAADTKAIAELGARVNRGVVREILKELGEE